MNIHQKAILPQGFLANGLSCGIKRSGKPDLALIYSELSAYCVGMFTSNDIKAAPVHLARAHLEKSNLHQALLINSGNANCFTGSEGVRDARASVSVAARMLSLKETAVLPSSTGIIGKRLPVRKITHSIPELVLGLSRENISKVAQAILTTDTVSKEITAEFKIGKKKVTICGIAKGAGMIAPNMATMLVFILTDAGIRRAALKKVLKPVVEETFNCITIDGCMSTNDSVLVMANGASFDPMISSSSGLRIFTNALRTICLSLAQMIVKDAEGATKFIEISVSGGRTFAEARAVGLAIANSNLFKCAMFGNDPNFGRVVASAGSLGLQLKEKDLKVKLSDLKNKHIHVDVSLGRGSSQAVVYTSDLTPEYVKINADYN